MVMPSRAGVRIDDDGITVRRYRGSAEAVSWDEVDRFEPVPNGNGGAYIAVVLKCGPRLTTQGLSAGYARVATHAGW